MMLNKMFKHHIWKAQVVEAIYSDVRFFHSETIGFFAANGVAIPSVRQSLCSRAFGSYAPWPMDEPQDFSR